jgi:hypothetical protein
VRCYCVGQEDVMIMPYDPRKPYLSGEQYIHDPGYLSAELAQRVGNDVRTLCRALGYDLNTVEFAIKDDVPYAIDFMNPAPDAEVASVGEFYHEWVTDTVTDLVFRRLAEPQAAPLYRWDAMLNPTPAGQPAQALAAAAAAAQHGAESLIPDALREVPSEIASAVGEIVGEARNVVSDIIESVTSPAPSEAKTTTKGTRSSSAPKTKTATRKSATTRAKKPSSDS